MPPPEMRTQLAALQQRERELLEKYNESSRTIQNLRQEIQAIKRYHPKGILKNSGK